MIRRLNPSDIVFSFLRFKPTTEPGFFRIRFDNDSVLEVASTAATETAPAAPSLRAGLPSCRCRAACVIGAMRRTEGGATGGIRVERKGFSYDSVVHDFVAAAAAPAHMLALVDAILFLSQPQGERSVAFPAATIVRAIACGAAVASSRCAFLVVIVIEIVFVPKVVPTTATPRVAAVVTSIAMVATRISPPATIGVLF